MFPSPYGDYFFNSIDIGFNKLPEILKFPSPYGDYFFNNLKLKSEIKKITSQSFRPLMGIIFLTRLTLGIITRITTTEFPSPYGDYFFNQFECLRCLLLFVLLRFRPLMGIIFLTQSRTNSYIFKR